MISEFMLGLIIGIILGATTLVIIALCLINGGDDD